MVSNVNPFDRKFSHTAREFTTRMMRLSSQAAASGLLRQLSGAFCCGGAVLRTWREGLAQDDITGLLRQPQHIAQIYHDQAIQDLGNMIQIAELTRDELSYWRRRWSALFFE